MAVRYTDGPAHNPSLPAPVRVQRVDPGEILILRMLSEEIGGMMTHFCQKRSRYCAGDECNPVFHRTEQIWKGYVACERWRPATKDWLPVVLEVTEHCELDMRGVYQRGQVWELKRSEERQQRHAPVEARLVSQPTGEPLPPAFDVCRVLVHLYHVLHVQLNVRNPLPPRLVLRPTPQVLPLEKPNQKKERA